jgi:hypothetical protein
MDTNMYIACLRQVVAFAPRERVLFIGTQSSILYTAVDTPARGRVCVCGVCV